MVKHIGWTGILKVDGQEVARVDAPEKETAWQMIAGYAHQYLEETNKKLIIEVKKND